METEPRLQEVIRHRVVPEDEGRMIRDVLRSRLDLSRRLLRMVLSSSGLSVNGQHAFMGGRVHSGDEIVLSASIDTSQDILPQKMDLSIYYEDEDLLVVAKPAGIVVHPTHGHYTGTLANGILHHWRSRGEEIRFRPLHRIDQDTSGLLAIAKSHYASQKMSKDLKKYLSARDYIAIVEGHFNSRNCTIDAPIGRVTENPMLRIVQFGGKNAITHAVSSDKGPDTTLMKLRLETGRTHQIRVHMAYAGHPLVADLLYGRPHQMISRQALHAASLEVVHPRTGMLLQFVQPMPEDMQVFWDFAQNRRVLVDH